MGNSNSRIDRFYGNYEKSFERIEKDVQRLQIRASARAQRKASLSKWSAAVVALAVALAVGIVYQVQQQPPGTYTYQQHFNRVGGAMAVPAAAFVLHWVLLLVLGLVEGRDRKKLKSLEAAKRSMVKELKDMSRFDKIKSLIDKFDPDELPPAAVHMGQGNQRGWQAAGNPGQLSYTPGSQQHMQQQRQHMQQQQQRQQQGQVPALLMKGSGQVAGAAALAVAGAGKAIMPLFDKLATSLISDNPMLLEDLRRAQMQLQDAEMRMVGAVQESYTVKLENIGIKQRMVELEKQLDLPPSFDLEQLQEQLQQQQAAQQQLPWVMQQCVQAGNMGPGMDGGAGYGSGGNSSWPGEGSALGGWGAVDGDEARPVLQQAGAISAPDTPFASAGDVQQVDSSSAGLGSKAGLQQQGEGRYDAAGAAGMGEGLQGSGDVGEGLLMQAGAAAAGLRQRKGAVGTE